VHTARSHPAFHSPVPPSPSRQGATLKPFIPQPILIVGVAPTQMQDLALHLVEPHEIHTGPFLDLVQVPLDGIPYFWCVNCTTQPGVVCKLAESALDLAVIDENVKRTGPSTDP